MGVPIIYAVAQYVGTHLLGIFWFFLLLGYFLLLLQLLVGTITGKDRCTSSGREHMRVPDYGVKSAQSVRSFRTIDSKRLYRSGKDRILGGVCGGIAEYFGVDPVLVRLIWVLAIFFFGTGILLYFVAWLIIPRNPDHKW